MNASAHRGGGGGARHSAAGGGGAAGASAAGPAPLAMTSLPSLGEAGTAPLRPHGAVADWPQALSNAQDARLAAEALRALVHDAVYLDEEAYSSAVGQTQREVVAQGYKRQVRDLENEVLALRGELERKDEQLAAVSARHREAHKQISELQQELESNAVVFRVHYQELLMRTDEIAKLQAEVDGLRQQQQHHHQQHQQGGP